MRERKIRQKDLKIKYDKKDLKTYLYLWIITGITTALVWIPVLLYGIKPIKETPVDLDSLVSISTLLAPFLSVFWIGLIVKLLEISGYLKRLEKYGYVVPESAKEYDNNLENLMQDREICREQGERRSKAAVALTVTAGIAAAFVIYTNFVCTRVPHIFSILFQIMLIGHFARQIPSRRFRDDVDIYGDPKRKVRRNLDNGLIEIVLLCVVITVFFVYVPDAFPGKVNPLFYGQAIRYEKEYNDRYEFFPDNLPDEAENILIQMTYEQMRLSFYISGEQIEKYKEIYKNMEGGMGSYSSGSSEEFMEYAKDADPYYLNVLEEMEDGDICYLYRFKTGWVFMNGHSGYVAMYGSNYRRAWN